ncbi:MAG: type II secretion system secretin GspD [Pseudomonadales bacterium]|nr:type II secretion system secretin GspD [Pseudomonadales bacterium]
MTYQNKIIPTEKHNHGLVGRFAIVVFSLLSLCATAQSATGDEQTWRMTAKGADINEFVAQVANITGKTFVIDPRLKGEVTVISESPMDKDGVYALFLSVLRLHNFTAVPSGDVIRIQQNATGKQTPGTPGELSAVAPEELVTRVIAAQNVDSAELVKILRPLIPQYGHIASVAQPNVVIISDHADNIIRLKNLIANIDVSDEEEVIMLPLKEAWVGTVVTILEKVAPDQIGSNAQGPQRVQIIANERNNSLVLRGKPRPIAEVLKIVDKLDQPATTTDATQVIPLSHADATAVANILNGILSGRPQGEDAPQQEATIQADESLNAVVARADPGTMSEILQIIEKLDIRKAQVLIEAAIVEITIDDSSELGFEFAAADASGETVPFISTTLEGVISSLFSNLVSEDGQSVNVLSGLANVSSPTLAAAKIDADAISFGGVVTALATHSNANLLSTPSILTLDNEEAHILVGREVPFRTGSFTTTGDGTSNPFTTVQREDVGVELTVTPHVHDGDSVRLEIAQQITNVLNTPVGGSGFADVVTSKRTIETKILAEDRQTIVLGGLIQDDLTDSDSRVPLLGDIPVLGNLFKSRSKKSAKTNLLVFLRPTVIRSREDAGQVTKDKYNQIWEVEINSSNHEQLDVLFSGERQE